MAESLTKDIEELMSELRRQTVGLEERVAQAALGFDSETYGRFLQHHDFNTTKTAKALIEHSRWRQQIRLDSMKPSSLAAQLQSGRIVYPGGLRDKKGRPYVILRARLSNPGIPFIETMRLVTFLFETMLKENPDAQEFVFVNDLAGFKMKQADPRMAKHMFELLNKHYPGRLGAIYLVNIPTFYSILFSIVKPVLSAQFISKMHFLTSTKSLKEFIDEDQLPASLDGLVQFDWDRWVAEQLEKGNDSGDNRDEIDEELVVMFSNTPAEEARKGCKKEGVLYKKAGYGGKFNKRFCVFRDTYLYYYKDRNESQPEAVIPLRGATIMNDPSDSANMFHIITVNGQDNTFEANNQQTKQDWIQTLQTALD
eukprot:TRINITY_DN14667_c0_g1_i1.p1 TRINITY_DN14667_c0_g1~~TRINITY_DN14667_c0_g1_i1.p1  ORF type:complete len:368 (-),score=89.24 TRINITY_DN14667_c0_g1_i1:207-1310(-)